jgi:hypothetical protein
MTEYSWSLAIFSFCSYSLYNFINVNAIITQTIFLSITARDTNTGGNTIDNVVVETLQGMPTKNATTSYSASFRPDIVQAFRNLSTTISVTIVGMQYPALCEVLCTSVFFPATMSSDFTVKGYQNVPGKYTVCEPVPTLAGCRTEFKIANKLDVLEWLLPTTFHYSLAFPGIRASSIMFNVSNVFSDGKITQVLCPSPPPLFSPLSSPFSSLFSPNLSPSPLSHLSLSLFLFFYCSICFYFL